jgi:imipenem/basic amino acid-specific outer membrane pore
MAIVSKKLLPLAIVAATAATLPAVASAADEGSFSASARTLYFNRDFHEGTEDRVSLTQALVLDYTSATFADRISFGASFFGNLKLDARKNAAAIGSLKVDANGDTESYAKLGQAYIDVALTENASLRAGRMVLGTPLLNDADSRATPSSTQAVMLQGKVGGADLYALYSDRASGKTESAFRKYSANGEDYSVVVLGGGYSFENGLSLNAAYGLADDYLQQVYLNAAYTFDLGENRSLLIDAYHYDGKADGNLYDVDSDGDSNPDLDYNSTLTNLAASYSVGNLALTASYQTTGGDYGYNYFWGGSDDNGLMTWNSVQYNDFNRKDEDSWQLRADYNFAQVPGLKGMVRHTSSEYDAGASDADAAETNVDVTYTLQEGSMKGLSLRLRYAHITDDADEDIDEVRVIANYSF